MDMLHAVFCHSTGTDTVQEIEWTAIVSQETPCGQPVSFDLTRAVKRWLQHPEDNLGVVVKVEDRQENMIDPRAVFKSLECANSENASSEQVM